MRWARKTAAMAAAIEVATAMRIGPLLACHGLGAKSLAGARAATNSVGPESKLPGQGDAGEKRVAVTGR